MCLSNEFSLIAEALNVSSCHILFGKELPGEVLDEEEKKVLALWRRMAQRDKGILLTMLDRLANKGATLPIDLGLILMRKFIKWFWVIYRDCPS